MKKILFSILILLAVSCTKNTYYDVVIIGGGASGTTAGVQASRMGAKTLIAEAGPWLGGMLTSAGVSAIDGNYRLRGGIFGEFCDSLAGRYGGYDSLYTGWVSKIEFEPHIGQEVLTSICGKEQNLTVERRTGFVKAKKRAHGWTVTLSGPDGKEYEVDAGVLIDCTELGDVAAAVGVKYHVGMDPRSYTGEEMACEEGSDVVQDMTMVAIVKDYGPDADMTIPMPEGYNPAKYVNCCQNPLNTPIFEKDQTLWSPEMMLSYGQLPGSGQINLWHLTPGAKTMLNWPVEANDFYANIIEMTPEQRDSVIALARQRTLGFVYFIQTGLGMKNIGLADDEFPTEDGLALIPYHRESRRIEGKTLFTVDAAGDPYGFKDPTYRCGVAVGDYPVDHHHFQNPDWKNLPKFIFSPIPSFTVPMGCLVPDGVKDLLVAEKSISVSNLAGGTTRLQPVVMELGQAAGTIAAIATGHRAATQGKGTVPVHKVGVREVQTELLACGARIQPYLDLQPCEKGFLEAQRVGSAGILHGDGKNVDWSDEMWMRTGDNLLWNELFLDDWYGERLGGNSKSLLATDSEAQAAEFYFLLAEISGAQIAVPEDFPHELDRPLTRLEAIIAIDHILDPFSIPIGWDGRKN